MGYIHIKTYVEKLRSLHVLREAIKVSTAAVEEAFEFTGSIDEFTSRLQERILKVTDGAIGRAQEPEGQSPSLPIQRTMIRTC